MKHVLSTTAPPKRRQTGRVLTTIQEESTMSDEADRIIVYAVSLSWDVSCRSVVSGGILQAVQPSPCAPSNKTLFAYTFCKITLRG